MVKNNVKNVEELADEDMEKVSAAGEKTSNSHGQDCQNQGNTHGPISR